MCLVEDMDEGSDVNPAVDLEETEGIVCTTEGIAGSEIVADVTQGNNDRPPPKWVATSNRLKLAKMRNY